MLAQSQPSKRWVLMQPPPFSPIVFWQHIAVFCGSLVAGGLLFLVFGRTGAAALCAAQAFTAFAFAAHIAIHATDGEEIELLEDRLVIIVCDGLRRRRHEFPLNEIEIRPSPYRSTGRYWLCHCKGMVAFGRHIDPIRRCLVASEIAHAVRTRQKNIEPPSIAREQLLVAD